MRLLSIPIRIMLAPVALAMTILLVPLALLLALSTRVLALISTIGVLLALLLFVTGDHHNGSIFLLLAFLISPYGLPMIAEWLWKRLADVRGIMWRFVFG